MFGPYELIPSGETSSYRSNPLGLAEFTLSRRDPAYVGKTKAVDALEIAREKGEDVTEKAPELKEVVKPHTNKFACFHCRFRRRTE